MDFYSVGNLGPRVQVHFEGRGRTKQAMRKECDINVIMAKYAKTGLVNHFSRYGGDYGFASSVSFHEAMNVVTKADQMFDDLPSKVRRRFNGDPASFLDFVQDPENAEEMIELGLCVQEKGAERDDAVLEPDAESAPASPEESAKDV